MSESPGSRIMRLRVMLNIEKQAEFAEILGVEKKEFYSILSSRASEKKTNHVVDLIAEHYPVNKQWLLTGEGECFTPFGLDEYIKSRGASNLDLQIAKLYFDIPTYERWKMGERLKKILSQEKES